MKLTKLFPINTKPFRIGIYQVKKSKTSKEEFYSYWDGKFWHGGWITIQRADYYKTSNTSMHGLSYWRGIAK